MAEFKPFQGIRYRGEWDGDLSRLICPPYDLISPEEQEFYYQLHPCNAIRLDFGRILPGDDEQENRYSRAKALLRQWLSEGILVREAEPAYYLLEEHFQDVRGQARVRQSVMGLRSLEENRPGTSIRPHEETYAGPKQDRFELMQATEANLSPILAVYQDPAFVLEEIFCRGIVGDGFPEARGEDGVRRRLLPLRDPGLSRELEAFFRDRPLLIADGHHRYETALAYRDWRRARDPGAGGGMPYDYTLMCVANMESPGVCAYPTHRLVKDLPGFDVERFLLSARNLFEVQDLGDWRDPAARERLSRGLGETTEGVARFGCCFKDPERCWLVTATHPEAFAPLFPPGTDPLVRTLDVSILHEVLLGRCLGLSPEEQGREGVLAYAKGVDDALTLLVRRPDLRAAFLLNLPDLQKIMKIAFSGNLLPRKTTYFFPKAATGLLFRTM